jgi:hypothetical protein
VASWSRVRGVKKEKGAGMVEEPEQENKDVSQDKAIHSKRKEMTSNDGQ